jgi:hypothetical protein
LQRSIGNRAFVAAVQGSAAADSLQRKQTGGGLPDRLKAGVESLSGVSMDSVHSHGPSPAPPQLNALAYAQGSDIHVGPAQEAPVPHEAWHVTQQAQGRVRPTMQVGTSVQEDEELESEADEAGQVAAASAPSVRRDEPS